MVQMELNRHQPPKQRVTERTETIMQMILMTSAYLKITFDLAHIQAKY
jgi:hypothetical protein